MWEKGPSLLTHCRPHAGQPKGLAQDHGETGAQHHVPQRTGHRSKGDLINHQIVGCEQVQKAHKGGAQSGQSGTSHAPPDEFRVGHVQHPWHKGRDSRQTQRDSNNKSIIDGFQRVGEQVVLIDSDYEQTIEKLLV